MDDSSGHGNQPGRVTTRPATAERDGGYIGRALTEAFGSTLVAGHGELLDAAALPGFVAEIDGEPVGMVTYRADGTSWEVVGIVATRSGVGAGAALLTAVAHAARAAGAGRLWLITTNDNTPALRSYQRQGWDLVALHREAVARARELKPTIPLTGRDGIPIRHELELELLL
jgi:GNAT superfamily N-acetyltransferase